MSYKMPLFLLLAGVCLWAALSLIYSGQPAGATEPTPTPTAAVARQDTPSDTLCHLAQGKNCTFINPLDMAAMSAKARQHPPMGASHVPTYTLVSTTFAQEMEPTTINPATFWLAQGSNRVAGTVEYIEAGKMAIFYPDDPLQPGTTYTATVSSAARNIFGSPLAQPLVWTFTTTREPSLFGLAGDDVLAAAGMSVYFGDLHAHTGYSDGKGTPHDAFTMARASGLDFFGLSEHAFMMTGTEWQDIINQSTSATINGQFVALPGFEYTHAKGHINVFGSSTFVHRDNPNYDSLDEFYNWLAAHPTAIGQFNHPERDIGNSNFSNFAYQSIVDHKIVLHELTTSYQFFLALNSGWHLGTLKNRDTHQADWGCCPLMGAVAANLTSAAILEALAAKRTFFVSPSDSNFALVMQANGAWMGMAIPKSSSINFNITAYDPDPPNKSLRVFVYENGVRVASTSTTTTRKTTRKYYRGRDGCLRTRPGNARKTIVPGQSKFCNRRRRGRN